MNKLEGIYTKEELAKMTATAQHLSNLARDMASMLIYCDRPEWHAQGQQDELQAVFRELHSVVLGLEPEALTEAHSEPNEGEQKGMIFTSNGDGSIAPQWKGHRGSEGI